MTTAAQLLIDTLVDDWGVRHVFGLPGDGINGIMEALRKKQERVRFVLVRHDARGRGVPPRPEPPRRLLLTRKVCHDLAPHHRVSGWGWQ